jgi:four helix bundle protein
MSFGRPIAGSFGMAGWKTFEEIGAWQRAREVKVLVIEFVERPKVARDFKYRDQIRDAARSAPTNIAEGFARFKHKEFAYFARVAKASEAEVLNHLMDALDSGYMTKEEFKLYEHAVKKALKAVNGLIRDLESRPDPEF